MLLKVGREIPAINASPVKTKPATGITRFAKRRLKDYWGKLKCPAWH